MRALGFMLIGLGLFMLIVPLVGLAWAWSMYSIGFSIDAAVLLIIWTALSGALIALGLVMLLRMQSRTNAR